MPECRDRNSGWQSLASRDVEPAPWHGPAGGIDVTKTLPTAFLLLLGVTLFGQSTNDAPYLNPDLTPEKRAADLVSRFTLEEKVLQMQNGAPAIPRLNIPAYNWWSEALHGVARSEERRVGKEARSR